MSEPTPIPFLNLNALHQAHWDSIVSSLQEGIQKGQFIGGEALERFENAFARWIGEGSHAVGCANGTDAIEIAATSLARKREKRGEAVLPAMTYIATASALLRAGYKLKLVDVDLNTGLMDLDQLDAACSAETRLIVPVHLYGQMVAMDRVREIADRHDCQILEDAAQAHGARWKDQPVGYWGDVATYSFYPGKNLGAMGDGGAILSRDSALVSHCRALGDQGGLEKYVKDFVGMNSRLDTLQAAILYVKLSQIDSWTEARRNVASLYREGLAGLESVQLMEEQSDARGVYHLFVVRVPDRKGFMDHLNQRLVGCGIHYPLALHQQPAMKWYVQGEYPCAEALAREGVSLPMCPTLTPEQVAIVIEAVRCFEGGRS